MDQRARLQPRSTRAKPKGKEMKDTLARRVPSRIPPPPPRPSSPVIGQPVDQSAWDAIDRQEMVELAKLGAAIERRVTAAAVILGCLMVIIMVARVAFAASGHG